MLEVSMGDELEEVGGLCLKIIMTSKLPGGEVLHVRQWGEMKEVCSTRLTPWCLSHFEKATLAKPLSLAKRDLQSELDLLQRVSEVPEEWVGMPMP